MKGSKRVILYAWRIATGQVFKVLEQLVLYEVFFLLFFKINCNGNKKKINNKRFDDINDRDRS